MKVKELLVKLVPDNVTATIPDGFIQGCEYKFYFDGELVENINGIKFTEKLTEGKPAVVQLEFEVDKITIHSPDLPIEQ